MKKGGDMYSQVEILCVILGMALVTYVVRVIPFVGEADLEKYEFLKYIPVAMFSSLAIPDMLLHGGQISPERTIAGIIALIVAVKTKRILLTICVAVITLYVLLNFS
ncbi:MAG: hypothetical protein DRN49_05280 [Thaumarchaeota archaeon]|nr:MAG: hypothetical protein DRN49_05280 [Nitrososphaerota archaeon]